LETTGIYTQQQVKELVVIAKLLDREWSRTGCLPLGSRADVTQVYAERDQSLAAKVMGEVR